MNSDHQISGAIGVFDSGYGGLTVARSLIAGLPHESIVYVGDSARCPYGPRELSQVDNYVQQIGSWLVEQGVKMIVIACNTATAAGLEHAQHAFPVPVVGVVNPGARAAVEITRNRRVGVIATKATVESGVYSQAIRTFDPEITVFSVPTPRFVEIAEQGLRMSDGVIENQLAKMAEVYVRPEFVEIAREYLEPIRRCGVDTLVLGCTHYPLLKDLIGSVMGRDVHLVSSADETLRDVRELLMTCVACAGQDKQPQYRFYTTGEDTQEFKAFGSRVLQMPLEHVETLALSRLEQY